MNCPRYAAFRYIECILSSTQILLLFWPFCLIYYWFIPEYQIYQGSDRETWFSNQLILPIFLLFVHPFHDC